MNMKLKKRIALILICLFNIAFVIAGCTKESNSEIATETVVDGSETGATELVAGVLRYSDEVFEKGVFENAILENVDNAEAINADSLYLSTMLSDTVYSTMQNIKIVNDTGREAVLSITALNSDTGNMETFIQYLPVTLFPERRYHRTMWYDEPKCDASVHISSETDSTVPVYIKLASEELISDCREAIINRDDCLKVSNLTTTPLESVVAHYIYNDTNEAVTIYYTDTSEQTKKCVLESGDLQRYEWLDFKDLHI